MKKIEITVYQFSELSAEAKQNAIQKYRESSFDVAEQAVDNCFLFEPSQEELDALGFKGEILLKNTRKNIFFDLDRGRYLNITNAIEVTDETTFLKFLGIPTELQEKIVFTFNNHHTNGDTYIEFTEENDFIDQLSDAENKILQEAENKWSDHLKTILKRIEDDIDHQLSDEYIAEQLEESDREYHADGSAYIERKEVAK